MKAPWADTDGLKRVDGRLKVTGTVRYAGEYKLPGMVYGVVVSSNIARGTIAAIDSKAAEKAPGVLAVISHLNAPEVPGYKGGSGQGNAERPFFGNEIYFDGQPVALVIATTLERARYASSLVYVKYARQPHNTDLGASLQNTFKPEDSQYQRGQAGAYRSAPVKIEARYRTPIHVHNAMEPFAVTAYWEGQDKVTVYCKAQYIKGMQQDIMHMFNLPEGNVQVYSKVIGGAFGSGSPLWPFAKAALIGARMIGKPLKTVLDRQQMFTMVGYRSPAVQQLGLGATREGKLLGITHQATGETATYEVYAEGITAATRMLYECPNVDTSYQLARLDLSLPWFTRGPGVTTGVFALESAMDELAYALDMDPLELRQKNYSNKDQAQNLPWSSKYLDECYQQGAALFGWNKRNPKPRSVEKDGWLVGYGLSNGVYGTHRAPAAASARLSSDGMLLVQSSTSDMGPGTATVMTKIASEIIDIPIQNIRFELGSSALPPAPGEYGSMTTSSVGSAVYDACTALKEKFRQLEAGGTDGAPRYVQLLKEHQLPYLEASVRSSGSAEAHKYSTYAYTVNFVEVNVQPATGMVKVTRVVTAVDGGRIISPITARSQIMGGIVWGIGMALTEQGVIDHRYGRYVNSNFSEYHVAVNADVPPVEVIFIDKKDPVCNPMGSKGIGEVGIVGFAAAVANAVFNATGIRVRDLPITPDKLLT
jgi:xanthine dehydrogenase YagR molybdenum-binding subunit